MVNDSRFCPQSDGRVFVFAVSGVVTTLLIVSGLCGIGYCTWILRRRVHIRKNRLIRLVLVLSAWDALLLLCTAGFYSVTVIIHGHKILIGSSVYAYQVFYPLCSFAMTGSLWTVTLITYERFLAISRPFQQRVRERKPIKWLCLAVAIGSGLLNLPSAFELVRGTCTDQEGQTQVRMTASWLRRNNIYLITYRVVTYLFFVCPIPFAIVVYLSVRILCLYRSAIAWRKSTSIQDMFMVEGSGNTQALIAVATAKFLVCYTLPTTINVIELFPRNTRGFSTFYSYLIIISDCLVVLNSASNWLIFSRWQNNPHRPQRQTTRRRNSFSRDQTMELHGLWRSRRASALGRELLEALLIANPKLIRHFIPTGESTESSAEYSYSASSSSAPESPRRKNAIDFEMVPQILPQGRRMGLFLDEVICDLIKGVDANEIRQKIRYVGQRHAELDVNLQNADWFVVKQFLLEKMFAHRKSVRSSELLVANKFIGFFIRQIKTGYQCQKTRMESSMSRKNTCNSIFGCDLAQL